MNGILFILSLPWFLQILFGSPNEHLQRVDQDLKIIQKAMNQGHYQVAHEQMNEALDDFNYIRREFPKAERQKWIADFNQFGATITVLNIKKSQTKFSAVKKEWETLKEKRKK